MVLKGSENVFFPLNVFLDRWVFSVCIFYHAIIAGKYCEEKPRSLFRFLLIYLFKSSHEVYIFSTITGKCAA